MKVGGIDVRKYSLKSLRDQVSMVLQKNVLFTGSIYENVRWGDENASDEKYRESVSWPRRTALFRSSPRNTIP